jgi:hypothetical protein
MVSGDIATAIGATKSQYFYGLDTKQWDVVRSVFTEEARFEGFPFPVESPDVFTNEVATFLKGAQTIHQGFMPLFLEIDETRVKARWTMYDYLIWHDSREYKGHLIPGQYGLRGYGYYEEEYVCTVGGAWLIDYMRLSRVRIDPLVSYPIPNPEYDVATPNLNWI